jgi:hypothetical protein
MRYLGQNFIDAGSIWLLAVLAITQAPTAEEGCQSHVTAFEPSHYPTALNKQPSLVQPKSDRIFRHE